MCMNFDYDAFMWDWDEKYANCQWNRAEEDREWQMIEEEYND